jgi:hypothetical protein
MPRKLPSNKLSEAERAKRLREAAKEHDTSNDPKDFEKAFKEVTSQPPRKA